MQSKPAGWPAEGEVEIVPEVFLGLTGSAWPPARDDLPAGTARVGSWSVDRQLTGSSLPGQVRGASGFSIATASASFPQPEGAPLSPWGTGALALGAGGSCSLYASHDGPGAGLSLGSFVVAPISGSNVSNAVSLDLDESSARLNLPFKLDWYYDPAVETFDAAWVLSRIAESAGYPTDIEPTGSPLRGVFGVAGNSAWDVAQNIAAATMGAVWITEGGAFTYRNRESLRGTGGYSEIIEAQDSLESLDWSVDPAEVADRVELTYTPSDIAESRGTSTLWEATETIRVKPGQTVIVGADITGTTDRLSPFIPIWSFSDPEFPINVPETQMSRWAAATSKDGSGTRPSSDALGITAKMVSPSRVRIQVTNRTSSTLWLVDGNGNPCLILRTSLHIQPGEPVTASSGADDEQALNPLSVDAGGWVQDNNTAQEMLEWLTSQTARAKATVNQVRVKPDLGRQLGDVVLLKDAHTELRSKALITGVHLSGDAGSYTQSLDFALLDVVFADYDRWMENNGLDYVYQLDDWLALQGFTTFDQFDEWLTNFGGTL